MSYMYHLSLANGFANLTLLSYNCTKLSGSMKEKVKRKKSKKKSSTASSHVSADGEDEESGLERKKKAK